MKEQELKYYKNFALFLQQYEESNSKFSGTEVKLVSGENQCALKKKLDDLAEELKNPLIHVKNWIKGEIMNL